MRQKTGKNIICLNCNKEFYASGWELKYGRKCCSFKCAQKFRRSGKLLECPVCHKKFYQSKSKIKLGAKYCSRKCFRIAYPRHPECIQQKVNKANTGRIKTDKERKKLSKAQKNKPRPQTTGEKNGMWKGDNASYLALHSWVKRALGKTTICSHCSKTGSGRKVQWANKSRKYYRDKNDWISLCQSCHSKYDKNFPLNVISLSSIPIKNLR